MHWQPAKLLAQGAFCAYFHIRDYSKDCKNAFDHFSVKLLFLKFITNFITLQIHPKGSVIVDVPSCTPEIKQQNVMTT